MMKRIVFATVSVTVAVFIFYSCKKQDISPIDLEVFKTAVQSWQQGIKNVSTVEQKRSNEILNKLDYSSVEKSSFEGNTVVLIKLKDKTAISTQDYLVLSQSSDSYVFNGIY